MNPQDYDTFAKLIARAAEKWPDRDGVILPEGKQSFAELYERAIGRAKQLIALGVGPGEHVGLLLATSFEFAEEMFGIALAGAVMVPINARYRANEITYLTENADLVTIVTTGQVAEGLNFIERLSEGLPGLAGAPDPQALAIDVAPKLRNVLVLGGESAPGFVSEADTEKAAADIADDEVRRRGDAVKPADMAMILYTSGTTSNPKGCMISGASIIQNGRAMAERYEMTEKDSFWSPLPMFHIAATFPMCGCFDMGSAYITQGYFDGGVSLKLLEDTKATVTFPCFVTIIADMINHPNFANTDLSHVRMMNSSLAMQPPGFDETLAKAMPDCIQVGTYGMSEASGTVTTSRLDDPLVLRETRLGSPLPGQEVAIRDPETGVDLPIGERGEICVRGPNTIMGYYRDPEKTAEALRDGWLHTGDIGSMDENNTLMFHGRFKDMLKVGGENVAAAEIESLLQDHPAVLLAQVAGLPDPRLVEVPVAFVELNAGESVSEQELIDFFKGKVSSFKIPRHIRFVTEWPMSTSKIQKFKLRDDLATELEAQRGAAE